MTGGGTLLVPYSAWGHVAPMLAVAAELGARGETVRVLVGERYRRAVELAGARPVVPAREHVARVPDGWGARQIRERARLARSKHGAAAAMARTLATELDTDRPALCVVDPHARGTQRLAIAAGVPTRRFWTTYPGPAGPRTPALANLTRLLWPRETGPISAVGPLMFDAPGAHPFPDPPTKPGGARLVVVSPGTVYERSAGFLRDLVLPFGGSRWTVVLAAAHAPLDRFAELPSNIVIRQWIQQGELVRRAAVLVTHGGMSSVHEAIASATPMLFLPRSREQHRTARRLCSLGLGEMVSDPARIVHQVERLADDGAVRARLRAIAAEPEWSSGPARAADLLSDTAFSAPLAARAGRDRVGGDRR